MIADGTDYTPTPVISHAILTYNRGRTAGLAGECPKRRSRSRLIVKQSSSACVGCSWAPSPAFTTEAPLPPAPPEPPPTPPKPPAALALSSHPAT